MGAAEVVHGESAPDAKVPLVMRLGNAGTLRGISPIDGYTMCVPFCVHAIPKRSLMRLDVTEIELRIVPSRLLNIFNVLSILYVAIIFVFCIYVNAVIGLEF